MWCRDQTLKILYVFIVKLGIPGIDLGWTRKMPAVWSQVWPLLEMIEDN